MAIKLSIETGVTGSGSTKWYVLYTQRSTGKMADTTNSTWDAIAAADLADYSSFLSEESTSGVYSASVPGFVETTALTEPVDYVILATAAGTEAWADGAIGKPRYEGTLGAENANLTAILDDSVAATNAESFFDGTGYAGGTTKLSINVASIDNNAITTAAINDGALTAAKIASDAITAAKIADGAIDAAAIAADAITAAKIADGAIDAATFAAGAINAAAIASDAITSAKIADGAITANKIATAAITNAKFAAGAIDAAAIADNAIDAGAIASNAITSAKIATDAIGSDQIAASAVTKIQNGLATSVEVTSIQNNTRVVRVVPSVIERPDSGTVVHRIELLLYDSVGNMEAPDAAPTISVVDESGNSRDVNLDSTTMSSVSTGRYRSTYTVGTSHDLEQLVFVFSVVEGGATRLYANTSLVVDTSAVDFTSSDRADLAAIKAKTDNLPSDPADASVVAAAQAAIEAKVDIVDANVDAILDDTGTSGVVVNSHTTAAKAELQQEATDALNAYDPPTRAEATSDANGIIAYVDLIDDGTSGLAKIATDVAAILVDTGATLDAFIQAIKAKTDNLPASPAAVGSAMTLSSIGLDSVLVESGISAGAGLTNDTGTQLTSINARQALAAILSSAAAVLSGSDTTTSSNSITIKQAAKPAGNTRIAATTDEHGNRDTVTLKVPD